MMNRNLDAFDARIKKIAKDEKARGQLIAGEGEVRDTQVNLNQLKRAAATKRESGNLILAAPKWAMAFVLGAVAMLAGRLLGFHVLGQFIAGDDMTMVIMRHAGELGIGIAVLVTAATFIGFRGGMAKTAMLAGFALMVLGESDVAGHAPYIWESMFSPEYAARVLGPAGGVENNLRALAGVLQSSI